VRLQKIPAHTINLVPTTTEFYLDTFKYSKKYHLSFKYPQDIRVDADDCEVVFEGGFLKITLPIIEIKDYATGKMIRKKGLRSQLHKQESLEIKKNKKKTKRQSAKVAEQPNSQNEKRDNLATLELIENINKDEDKKREIKLQKENSRNSYFEAKEKAKEQRKRKRQKLREKSLTEAHLKKVEQKTPVKDSTKREKPRSSSVTFVDTVQVKEFVPNEAPTSKKPKVTSSTKPNTSPKSKKEKRKRKKQRNS